jgi:hypothetical protein
MPLTQKKQKKQKRGRRLFVAGDVVVQPIWASVSAGIWFILAQASLAPYQFEIPLRLSLLPFHDTFSITNNQQLNSKS